MRAWVGAALLVTLFVLPGTASAEPATRKRGLGGWTTFGAELGFFGGMALMLGTIAVVGDDAATETTGTGLLVGSSAVLMVGGPVLGGWGFRGAAANGQWDRHVGWGAAGVFPGLMGGFVLSAGALMAATGEDSTAGLRLSVGALGAGLGSTIGYFAFKAMSEARGDAGWEHLFYWVSFFACETAVLITTARTGQRNVGLGFVLIGVGATMGTAFTHLIAS